MCLRGRRVAGTPGDRAARTYCASRHAASRHAASRVRGGPRYTVVPRDCGDYFVLQAVGLQGSIVPFFRPANAAFSAVVSSAGGVMLRMGASGMARFQAPFR